MKRIISMLMTLCLLTALCPAGAEEAPSMGKPWANPNMFSEFSVRPGPEENYYIYANYDLLAQTASNPVPGASLGTQTEESLADQFLEICLNSEYTDTDSRILQILYKMIADTEKREKETLSDLMVRVDRVKAVKTTQELTDLMLEEGFLTANPFFTCNLQSSALEPGMMVITVNRKAQLEYTEMADDPTEEELMNGPQIDRKTPRKGLLLMGYGEDEADRIISEIERYDNAFTATEPDWLNSTSSTKASLLTIREKCLPLYAQITAEGFVQEGAETREIYEIGPGNIGVFTEWYTDENLETLKAIVALSLYKYAKTYLGLEAFTEGTYETEGKAAKLTQFKELRYLAFLVTEQAYVDHYCPEEKWAIAVNLFEELREAMRSRVQASEWMSEESKKKCMDKLADLDIGKIVPPGGKFDFTELLARLSECGSLMDAAAHCVRLQNRCRTRFAGEPMDRTNPYVNGTKGILTDNGQYEPGPNIFNIGATALNGVFCDFTSRETVLGTLGFHIAHELSHGYDLMGARRDVTGTDLLFTQEDYGYFEKKAMEIAAQLSAMECGNGVHVQGEQVIYEAMADLAGMTLLLDLVRQEEDFDYDAFFRAPAGIFFSYKYGEDYHPSVDGRVDPHPPHYIRINFTLAHFDEFYETYPSVTEGTPMYLAPEERILVW